jgi:SEL1 protein
MALGYRHLVGAGVPQSCDSAAAFYEQVAETVLLTLVAASALLVSSSSEVVAGLSETQVASVVERVRLNDDSARDSGGTDGLLSLLSSLSLSPLFSTSQLRIDSDVIQYYKHSAEAGDVAAQVSLGHVHYYGVTRTRR